MWEEKGFIQIEPSDDDMTWIGGVGNILLWNRVGNIPRGLAYKRALFGKTDLIEKELPLNCTIWGSYTDHVRDLEVIGSRDIGVNRDGGVVFMGRITDKGTLIKRAGKRWSGACD